MGLSLGARRRLRLALANLRGDEPAPGDEGSAGAADGGSPGGAERGQLTVMFCDLVGSSALAAQVDPEDMLAVLREFQDACTREISRYGGFVAKLMGDGVLAYFGYPEAHENDAERAVHAGLDIIRAAGARRARADPARCPPVRIGVATGEVVVGNLIGKVAAQEAAVTGETPNLAARLQALAEPDTVVVDRLTKQLAGGGFEFGAEGVRVLKGFPEPQAYVTVRGRRPVESRFAAARDERLSALVGRDEELEILRKRWRRIHSESGQLVLISGEPGIGKSRLVHGLVERIGDEPHLRMVHQCSPFHINSALYPVIDCIERSAGFQAADSPDARLDKLESLVGRIGRECDYDVPLLAALVAVPMGERYRPRAVSPQRLKELTIEMLAAHIAALAAQSPVLFVLEDAHWIDPTTRELLDLLVEKLQETRVLVLVTHRPEFGVPWAGRAAVTQLALNRLGRAESAILANLQGHGAKLPAQALEQIVSKTDGVPLFIEEFTRAAAESGGGEIAIPTTLHDALESRLGRLEAGRDVAQIAAAVGRRFGYEMIAAVCGDDAARVRRALEELVAAGLVFVRGEPPEAVYTFKHALVQDTAYNSLLRGRRREIHARIADVLEREFPSSTTEEPEVIAHHLTRAERIDGAIPYWERAGKTAALRFANAEAIHHYSKAIELVRSLPSSAERAGRELTLQIHLAPVHMAAKGFAAPGVEIAYRRALELAREIDDGNHAFIAQWGLWMVSLMNPASGPAKSFTRELMRLSEKSGDAGQLLQANHASWTTHFVLGEFESACATAAAGSAIYDPDGHAQHKFLFGGHDPGTCACNFYSISQCLLGNGDSALERCDAGLALAARVAHPLSSIATQTMVALIRLLRREPRESLQLLETAIELSKENGVPTGMWGDALRGWIVGEQGDPVEGVEVMARTFGEVGAVGQEPFRPFYLGIMAQLCDRAGRVAEGLGHVAEGLEIAERDGRSWCMAELLRIRGDLMVRHRSPAAEIAECFRSSAAIAHRQNARLWQLRTATSLARWQAEVGRGAEAREQLAAVYASHPEKAGTPDVSEAKALLDDLSG